MIGAAIGGATLGVGLMAGHAGRETVDDDDDRADTIVVREDR